MRYDINLQWRPGACHHLPHALLTLPLRDAPVDDVEDSFPDYFSTKTP